MYGRVMSGLQYHDDTGETGHNNFLRKQLADGRPSKVGKPIKGNISKDKPRHVELTDDLGDADVGLLVAATVGDKEAKQVFAPGAHIVSVMPKTEKSPASFAVSADAIEEGDASITLWKLGIYLARIYAFSFEGAMYSMPRPAIFVVHSSGHHVGPDHFQGRRSSVDQSGVVAREWEFASSADLRYWEYEKGDFSLRLDTEAGPFEQILLQASLRAGGTDRSGASLEIRSGASLSGASLSGASLSGASLSGTSLSGASLKR
jgi:hypothetical protein